MGARSPVLVKTLSDKLGKARKENFETCFKMVVEVQDADLEVFLTRRMPSVDAMSQKRLKEYQKSFDDLISMIPLKYYMATEDDFVPNKFVHNKKNKAPKQEIKEASRRAKKAKLDPEAQVTLAQIQTEKASKKPVPSDTASGLHASNGPAVNGAKPLSITELRDKLKQKIEELRTRREKKKGTRDEADAQPSDQQKAPKSRQEILERRLKKKKEKKEKAAKKSGTKKAEMSIASSTEASAAQTSKASAEGIDIGTFKFSKVDTGTSGQKRRNGDTKSLLLKAEKKAKKLEMLQEQNPEKARAVVDSQKWSKALKMAEGDTVKDDIKLLKKTLKKKEKSKAKSAKDWEGRISSVTKAQEERQRKRTENLRNRAENKGKGKGKVSKPARKPAARPGFEGGNRKKK
ncbi:surfeit locus protein [Phlyctochytrium bullatum]|nr:surfeit locus protein [Phlyctochytrium bullatum]